MRYTSTLVAWCLDPFSTLLARPAVPAPPIIALLADRTMPSAIIFGPLLLAE